MSWAGPYQYDIGKSRSTGQPPVEIAFDPQRPTMQHISSWVPGMLKK